MKCQELRDKVSEILQDEGMVTWNESHLLSSLRLAIRAVCVIRPEAYTATGNIVLVDGTEQSLPAGGQRLIACYYNIDSNDNIKEAVVDIVKMSDKSHVDRGWFAEPNGLSVYEVIYEESRPGKFWVSPPVAPGNKLRATWTLEPAVEDLSWSSTFPIDDKYASAAGEYMLYLSFARDSDQTPNAERAARHRNMFFDLMQVKMSGDVMISPAVRGKMN